MPARWLANIMPLRAARSAPSSMARGRWRVTSRIASCAHRSPMGLTWALVYAPRAWMKASMPVEAVIREGTLTVSAGSRIASWGRQRTLRTRYFLPVASLTSAPVVASLPVPAVLGRTMNPMGVPVTSSTPLASISSIERLLSSCIDITLDASIELPPPSATSRSKRSRLSNDTPSVTSAIVGFGLTSLKMCTSTPDARRIAATRSARPARTSPASVTRSARFAPRALARSPRPATAPTPKVVDGGHVTENVIWCRRSASCIGGSFSGV